ncbi:Hypothetical_protein [Hexamita inflata]|uniref:Hypothetical_protein n=1 Tax=Hexamita inflata TaxID=28002 RepID=A0AA86PF24_9EUKA|nr:Hypothetical protein HINF_LOCUS25063 [Hexamita inflata]
MRVFMFGNVHHKHVKPKFKEVYNCLSKRRPYYETGACVVKCTTGSYHVVSGATQSLVLRVVPTMYLIRQMIIRSNVQTRVQTIFRFLILANAWLDACLERIKSFRASRKLQFANQAALSMLTQPTATQSNAFLHVRQTHLIPTPVFVQPVVLLVLINSTGSFVCQDACANYFIVNASNSEFQAVRRQLSSGPNAEQSIVRRWMYNGCSIQRSFFLCSQMFNRAYEASGSDLICVSSCSGMYITNTSNQNSKKCITVCPSDVLITKPARVVKCNDWIISRCFWGYSIFSVKSRTNYVFNTSNDNSKQCLDTCPDDLPFSDSGKCVARCMSGAYQVFSSLSQTLVCQSSCTLRFQHNQQQLEAMPFFMSVRLTLFRRRSLFSPLYFWKLLKQHRFFRLSRRVCKLFHRKCFELEFQAVRRQLSSGPNAEQSIVRRWMYNRCSIQRSFFLRSPMFNRGV